MRFFELHFNPRKTNIPDSVFDSFCYEPENVYERRLGSLFIVGQLQNVLPSNLKFLDNLSVEIKKRYYSSSVKLSAEAALKDCLKKTNEFLQEKTKQGDVSWLGNLNLAVFSVLVKKSNFEINFSKVGEIKILLVRSGQIIDMGKNLEYAEIEPYPLKIFDRIVTGKLAENDVIIALTKDVFGYFSEKSLLGEIATINPQQDFGRELTEILKNREKELLKISGICLLCQLSKEIWKDKRKSKTSFTFQKEAERFSLKMVFSPVLYFLNSAYKKIPNLGRLKPNFTSLSYSKKNLILVLMFIFLLLLGFLIFR